MFTENEQQALDLDWFFMADNKVGFVASAGGKLPSSVSLLDEGEFNLISSYFRNLPEKSIVEVNSDITKVKKVKSIDSYLKDFVFMAKKGLYCYDKKVLNDFSHLDYYLVAKPKTAFNSSVLPEEILAILQKTVYPKDIEHLKSFSITEIS
ncbi:hypothetical protein [Flavobacterium aurantiibacter]|uniref:Uncharacterized protein n=1 Tax=Flavobacterium aurantiibacter TaxID=2023067 RepID=A0A256AB34_9FLAO|nr:hypothetical protein [Flavobacterium aurantiibacter]OYQ50364.1 hypothetical protein CHX27_00955 [Flavobacterium aurantiibacter]